MAESKGPPRKTTTYNRFSTMASQNQRYNTKQDEFYWLENIMRVAPHKLHSVPGPGAAHFFPNVSPCITTTIRGQQQIEILDYFKNQSGASVRTSWGFMDDNEVISTLVGDPTCASGNMAYTDACCTVNNFIGGGLPASTSLLGDPNPIGPFANTRIGVSDIMSWGAISNAYNGLRIYYSNGTPVDYAIQPNQATGGYDLDTYTIRNNNVWTLQNVGVVTPPSAFLMKFDRVSGTLLNTYNSWGNDLVGFAGLQSTTNFLYCIGNNVTQGKWFIYKINQSDGSIADSLDVTALSGRQFVCVASDDLLYVLCGLTPASVYYVENFTNLFYVGYTPAQGFTPFSGGSGFWKNGALYYGSNGFSGFSVDIFKIAVPCPPDTGPIIASVTTAPTVVAGNDISVSWSRILTPTTFDTILIKPEPAAGVLGLSGTTIATGSNSGGTSSGTISINIPGGTTPGNYVAMYAETGSLWAATSNPFTVT